MSSKPKEIGSEFWFEDDLPMADSDRDGIYVLSGRTAINLIIQDILKSRKVHSVYMPAWCCDSMLASFVDQNVRVDFYDVYFDGQLHYLVDEQKQTDIFYVTDYFGYDNTIDTSIIKHFKDQGVTIVYDRTHSMLMEDVSYDALADYSFASVRKWMGVMSGAIVKGVQNRMLRPYPYLTYKETAMRMKRDYMAGDDLIDKQEFLRLYGKFNYNLATDYVDYAMDDLSYAIYKAADISTIKARRRKNAKYLHEHLGFRILSPFTDTACPLFVPVLFDTKEKRDLVRNKLIKAEIYCPIHWPKPALISKGLKVNKIYDTELSLICDQRYGIPEMQKIIETIQ